MGAFVLLHISQTKRVLSRLSGIQGEAAHSAFPARDAAGARLLGKSPQKTSCSKSNAKRLRQMKQIQPRFGKLFRCMPRAVCTCKVQSAHSRPTSRSNIKRGPKVHADRMLLPVLRPASCGPSQS